MQVTHITPQQLAERFGVSPHTLAIWRMQGSGPRYIKFGRRVVYSEDEIEAYLKRQTRESTSQIVQKG